MSDSEPMPVKFRYQAIVTATVFQGPSDDEDDLWISLFWEFEDGFTQYQLYPYSDISVHLPKEDQPET